MNTTGCVYGLLNLKLRNLIFSTLVFIFLSAKQIKLNIYKSSHHTCQKLFDRPFFQLNGKSLFKMKENYFSFCNVFIFSPYLCYFIGSGYFSFNFGAFLKFWGNSELASCRIQDGCPLTITMS